MRTKDTHHFQDVNMSEICVIHFTVGIVPEVVFFFPIVNLGRYTKVKNL